MNGDGKLDLATSNRISNSLSVLLGNGDGTFQAQQTITTDQFPYLEIIGDVNSDGIPDLLTDAINGRYRVSVLLGNGDGTFQAQQPIATGLSVTLGDVNGDGKPDLIVADEVQHTGTITVLLGNGDGTFQSLRTYTTAAFPNSLTLKDMNGDGKPDLAFANQYNDTLSVLSGNGDGTFRSPKTFASGIGSVGLLLGDVNGDGQVDFFVANNLNSDRSVARVLLGNVTGNFSGPAYTLDHTLPTVKSINRTNPVGDTTNASNVTFTVTFSQPMTGVDLTDFSLVKTGTVGATLTQVTAVSPSVYTVTVSRITGNGTLGLKLVDNDSIKSLLNVPLGGRGARNGNFTGQTYTIDQVSPTVQSINRTTLGNATTNGSSVSFTVTFSEPVTGVDLSDFSLVKTGTIGATLTEVTVVSKSVYKVTVSGVTGDGTLGVQLLDNGRIHDLAGNSLDVRNFVGKSFANKATFDVVSYSYFRLSMTEGDVNGDGKLDLVAANEYDNRVGVSLGNGDGTFQPFQSFATGVDPVSVTLGDVNGDNKLDLVVANHYSDSVSVLLGNGNGTFQAQQTFNVGHYPQSIAVGDLNGDHQLDLAVANSVLSNTVSVLLGNGDGTFQAQQTFVAGGFSNSSMRMEDLNADGKLDLAVADRETSAVSIFLGNGNGTFKVPNSFLVEQSPISMVLGDVNGDGKSDIVVANHADYLYPDGTSDRAVTSDVNGTISVLLGNGDGTFQSRRTFATGMVPASVTLGDLNRDGILDLVIANRNDDSVSVLYGNGDSTFQAQQTFATGYRPISVTLGDVNGDGRADLVVPNYSNSTVSVLLSCRSYTSQIYSLDHTFPSILSINRTSPANATSSAHSVSFTVTFSEAVTGVDATDFRVVASGTVGKTTMKVTGRGSVYTVTVSGITGNGTLGLNLADNGTIRDLAGNRLEIGFASAIVTDLGNGQSTVKMGDVNGDGKLDLVATNDSSQTVDVLLGNGNGTFQDKQTFAVGRNPTSLILSDVSGDGKLDIIVANISDDNLSVLLGNGDGTFKRQGVVDTDGQPAFVMIGDVNGDGKLDLVVRSYRFVNVIDNSIDPSTPRAILDLSAIVRVLLGNGDGTFQAQPPVYSESSGFSVMLTVDIPTMLGDVNGDRKLDLVINNGYQVRVFLGKGDGTFQGQQTFEFASDSYLRSLGLKDVNGDNTLDLVFTNNYTNTVSVLLGNGNGTFHAPKSFASGKYTSLVTVGDVDGDGNPDLIVAGSSDFSSTLSVLLGNGNGTFQPPQSFAVGSLWSSLEVVGLMAGDLNGDGTPDIVVTNNGYEYLYLDCGFENTLDAPGPLSNAPDVSLIPLFYSHSTVSVLLGKGNGNFTGQVYAIVTPPSVTKQPLNTTVKSGAIASFTVAANGSPTPTVQWQVSTNNGSTWSNIAGETKATYSFTTALGNSGNQYRAVFTNQAGTVTSKAAKLTMRRP